MRLSIFLILISILSSCKKDSSIDLTERNELHQRLNGKYEIVTAHSDKMIDINLDGIPSKNMFQEIPDLINNWLMIRIVTEPDHRLFASQEHMLALMWPEQFLYTTQNDLTVDFIPRALPMSFRYNKVNDEIELLPPNLEGIRDEGYVVPSKIIILKDDHLSVEFEKELDTSEGIQKVFMTVLYKKWTSET